MSVSFRKRLAFTLVELLVVIAIIGILIALLLPAVQAAREAARRSQCTNNIKQISLSLHNFHDKYKRFPPGAAADQRPFGTLSSTSVGACGSSWMVYILPYMEQNPLFEKLEFVGGSGWNYEPNIAAISGVFINCYFCPSSPLPETKAGDAFSGLGWSYSTTVPTYVGISGAVDGLIPGYSETRCYVGVTTTCCDGGTTCAAGVLYPNSQINFADMTDGTSNTLAIGEHGDFLEALSGTTFLKVDWRGGQPHGFQMGNCNTYLEPPNNVGRNWNCTTVRWRINDKDNGGVGWPYGSGEGDCSLGVCYNNGGNVPLNSAHPGGIVVGLCDGSARFLSETTTMEVLAKLATRDDGVPVGQF